MIQDCLFVYGTLRKETAGAAGHLLARYAIFLGEATYQGRLYRINDYPGVVTSDDAAHQVKGEVYSLLAPAVVLPALDQYEECGPGFAEPAEYVRVRQEVVLLGSNQKLFAWIYLYNRTTEGLPLIISGDFSGNGGRQDNSSGEE